MTKFLPAVRRINRAEYKRWYYDPKRSQAEIAERFQIHVSYIHRLAKKFDMLTRQELEERDIITFKQAPKEVRAYRDCDRCNSRQWCNANPYALKLPCEAKATDHIPQEIAAYHSPNGHNRIAIPLVWDEDNDTD